MAEYNWGALISGIGAGITGATASTPSTTSSTASQGSALSNALPYIGIGLVAVVALLYFTRK